MTYMKVKIALVTLAFFFLLPSYTLATNRPTDRPTERPDVPRKIGLVRNLTTDKLRSCQAKENSLKKRLASLIRTATNMLEKFDSIANRVKEFYINKVLSSGRSVSNYDALLADVEAKKALVQDAINKAKEDADSFTCTGNDPKGTLSQYRVNMQAVKTALKNYRTSIKNLIVGIHSQAPKTSPSPTP